MHLTLMTAPAAAIVTVDEAKAHLRVDGTDDDSYITALVAKATQAAERYCDRAFIHQDWALALDAFPACGRMIKVPLPPLVAVTRLSYVDGAGADQVLAPADYQMSRRSPAIIAPAPGKSWPATQAGRLDAVTVEFTAGYGDAASDVPAPIHHAILLLVAHWYENREPVVTDITRALELPFSVDSLLSPYRVWSLV